MASASKVIEKDTGFKEFVSNLRELDGHQVVVGITAKDGAKSAGPGLSLVGLAQIHEFGAPAANIPQRSFLRETFDSNRNKYDKMLKDITTKAVKRTADPRRKLFVLGETVRNDILNRIADGIAPPLKPATVARKGSDTPLVDTGLLRNSIRSEVVKT